MLDMYKGLVNSPETTITNDINAVDTIIYVLDETKVPEELPNLMTLGTGTSAETVKVLEVNGNALTVERGFQGVPRNWNAGTIIARNFTEYDYNALVENVKTLKTKTDTNADDILDLMSYVGDLENLDTTEKANLVLALNETYQKLAAHKAEDVTQGNPHGIDAKANKGSGEFIQATLENGWVHNSSGVIYAKNDVNIVTLVFRATSGSIAQNTVITTLPTGYRPRSQGLIFPVFDGDGTYGGRTLQITKSGAVRIQSTVDFIENQVYTGHVLFEGV